MSKVFRLHTGASDNIQDWSKLHSYLDTTAISTIKDPAGGNARRQITSIPSPFARIDLVKRAFQQVVDSGSLAGTSIYHKMVADTLDIAQIFFYYPQLSEKIEIIPWNPGLDWVGEELRVNPHSDLGKMLAPGSSAGQKLFAETLKMFFSEDRAAYNFDKLQQFYLVNYKSGTGRLNIIGSTSPASLFMASANEPEDVDIQFGPVKVFDSSYRPLHERNEEFIVYLYSLEKAIPNFATKFRSLYAYLEASLHQLSAELRKKVGSLTSTSYDAGFDPIYFENAGNHPEILGHPLRSIRIDSNRPQHSSDFVIATTRQIQGRLPLVLPNATFNTAMTYVDSPWPAHLKAPYFDAKPLEERVLPGLETKYPYLTVNDLLEPYLVQLPFEPNRDSFFAGRISPGAQDGYLIPVTPLFFEYFRTEDLMGLGADGQPMFEFTRLPAQAIKAKLRIPIGQNKTVEFERIYHSVSSQSAQPEENANRGLISPQQFSLVVYPFVRRETGDQGIYTVMHIDRDVDSLGLARRYKLQYFRNAIPGKPVEIFTQKKKSDKRQHLVSTGFDLLRGDFDYVFVENGKTRACVIPLMPVLPAGNQQYSFAIDFGTTNTHVEYSVDGGRPRAFEMTGSDSQIGMLHRSDDATYTRLLDAKFGIGATLLLDTVSQELMPETIGAGSKNRFPTRTVVSEPRQIDFNAESYPFADFSVYWPYEQINRPNQLQYHTNLKWSNISQKPEEKKRIEGYIANLLQLVRNKVVLNGGNLSKTKIVWFYPSSMSRFRLNTFEKIWSENIERYLGPQIEQMSIPESVAPFYYFRSQEGVVAGNHPVINIDIGGGTTDVVVYEGQQVRSYTSFKFAANKLFGDGYGNNPRSNGFVQFFERNYLNLLGDTTLRSIYSELEQNGRSEDIISFLFGLENNPERQKLQFSFNEKLHETSDLKIVPLLFIASIFYHVAQYQKAQGGALPRYITFSGTGSKVLNILDASPRLVSIKRLCNLIFNEVFETNEAQIDLKMTAGPKEGTAKGGLSDPQVPTMSKSVLSSLYSSGEFKPEISLQEAQSKMKQAEALREVRKFLDRFFAWNKSLNYHDEFALDPSRFEDYKEELTKDLDVFMQEGLDEKKVEMNGRMDEPMDETMFFLPLSGSLNKLAYSIVESQIPA